MAYRFGQMHTAPGLDPQMASLLGYGYGPERITANMPDQKALLTSRFAADPPKKADTSTSTEQQIANVLMGLLGIGLPAAKLLMKSGALDGVIGDLFGGGSGTVPGDFVSGGEVGLDVLNGGGDIGADVLAEGAGAVAGPATELAPSLGLDLAGADALGGGALDVGIGPGSAAFESATSGVNPLWYDPAQIVGGSGETALEGGALTDLLGEGAGGFDLFNGGAGLFTEGLLGPSGSLAPLGGFISAAAPTAAFLGLALGAKELAPPDRTFNSYGGAYSQNLGDLSPGAHGKVDQLASDFLGDRSWLPEGADTSRIGRLDFDAGTFGKTGNAGNGSDFFSIGGIPYRTADEAIAAGRDIALKRMDPSKIKPLGIDFSQPNAVHNFWAGRTNLPTASPATPIDSVSWRAAQDRFQNQGMGEGQNMVTPMESDPFFAGLDREAQDLFRLGWNPYNAYAFSAGA